MASQYRTRDYAPFSLVHFTVRGFNKRDIFLDRFDHEEFIHMLRGRIDRIPIPDRPTLLAYGQMTNHQHVFTRLGANPKPTLRLMHSVCTSYAMSHNERYGRHGKVFQQPYRGKRIFGGDHIANTFAYIHLNPDATLRFENSSHAVYVGLKDDPHIDQSLAWRVFGGPTGYREFFNDAARLRAARASAKRRLNE